jgi:hypothetical protein
MFVSIHVFVEMIGAYIKHSTKYYNNAGCLGEEKTAGIPDPKLVVGRFFLARRYEIGNGGKQGSKKT